MKPATPQADEPQPPAGWTIQAGAGGWRAIHRANKWATNVFTEKAGGAAKAVEAAQELERRAVAEIERRQTQAQSLREAFRPRGGKESMKAITLTQPYATLVAVGAKRIETRSWSTSYRGPLAIHAAKGPGDLGSFKAMCDMCGTQPFFDALMSIVPNFDRYCDRDAIFERLPLGAIVAVCDLVDCVSTGLYSSVQRGAEIWQIPPGNMSREYSFGNYGPDRYAWLLSNIRALPEPIPAKGALGLWDCDLPQLTDAAAARD